MSDDPFADLVAFYERLADADIPCLIVGSVAAMFYGEPRTTIDIDLVVQAVPADAERIASAFRDDRYYVPHPDIIARELARPRGSFNIIDTSSGLKADCYAPANDALGRYERDHAVQGMLGALPVRLAPPAAIIAMKLRYHAMSGQDKHLRDIRAMLATSPEQIDHAFLDAWTHSEHLTTVWLDCQNRAGEE